MPKHLNPNLVKIHRNYTVEEAAALFGLHKNTVRIWIKAGLPICDAKRPVLILGHELKSYLQVKRVVRKQRCKPHELYCMRCRSPKRPAGNMVDYIPMNATTGRLVGLCPSCDSLLNRFAALGRLSAINEELDVCIPVTERHINKSNDLPVNSDSNRGMQR